MEDVSAERLAAFLSVSSGYGDGSGDGSGYGSGYGSGDGYGSGSGDGSGSGYGSGYGSGSGYGYGSGSGYGFKTFCGLSVSRVDGIPCVIRRIKGSVAKAEIINGDFSTTACYIVKQDNLFAHGATLKEAMDALREKLYEDMPQAERIAKFVAVHQPGQTYPDTDYFSWHHILTGSCDMGRRQFAESRGLGALDGERTPEDFIRLTENAYGGDVIRELKRFYPDVADPVDGR